MEERVDQNRVRIYPSDWRWSASIVGLHKYFEYLQNVKYTMTSYESTDDYIEFNEIDITDDNYLFFAEYYFSDLMHHKIVEDLLAIDNPTEEQIKLINDKLSKNTMSNTIMLKTFKGIKYDGKNAKNIQSVIDENRFELIKQTFTGGRSLYYNFCNENNLLTEKGSSCRIKGFYIDMGKKSKSVSYMRDKNNFVYQDNRYFDFLPFAFSKSREAFFINNNFTIDQLISSNKNNLLSEESSARSQLFFKVKNSSSFIDFDVEVIKKEREKDYFETIFVRNDAIKLFEKINDETLLILTKPCNAKRNEKSQDVWLDIEKIVVDSILNKLKLDDLIEKLFKTYNNHRFLISNLIKINQLVYEGGEEMTDKQRKAYGAAMEVKGVLKGKENKLRAYEQRLISALSLKDYERVQEILLHLSAFTQVRMDFLIDIFENFEKNKNLVYTFVNTLGEKKRINNDKGDGI